MARAISYYGLPSYAVRVFQRRPFNSVGHNITRDILKQFLTENNQKFKRNDCKELLVLRCEKYIKHIEELQKIENDQIANPPPEAGDLGKFPPCMICLDEPGKFALIPCGHTGCCSVCSASILNSAIPNDPIIVPPPNLAAQPSTSSAPDQPRNQGGGLILRPSRLNLGDFLVPRPGTPRPFVTRNNVQESLINQPVRIGNPLNNSIYVKCPICQARSTFIRLHFA